MEGGTDHLRVSKNKLEECFSNGHLGALVRFYELAGKHTLDETSASQHFLINLDIFT